MSKQLDNTHIPTSSISNITGLSPTIIQEAAIEDAFDSATTRDSKEIASALGDGHSSIANNFEVHLDTLIDTNFLLVGTDSVMGDEHSGHADQVFDESSHQIEDSVHEFDMAFDLVEDNSMGLQMPLQVTEVVSTPTWCVEIDYRGDMHSRKSNVAEDECLETNTDIVFGGSLQRNESTLQGQFANLKLVVTENSVFHETLSSNFDAPIRVDGEISLIPRDDEDEIAESYPSLFNQSFFAHFGALAIESMTDGLPTCYWFDTGQYVSQSITFVFRRRKCGDHLSATDFDKNDYLPIIGAQGGNVQFCAIMCSSCYSSGDDSKTACEGAGHNWLLDVLASYVLAKESGNSKVHQMFDTISNEAWKEKFNEGIRHAECFFSMDAGVNLFIVKVGGMVKVNCVWDPGISSKTMHQNGLMETTEAHLLLEFIDITSRLLHYFFDAHLKESTQSKKRRKTTLRGLLVFSYVWLSLSQDKGWQVLLDIYTCVEAKDMPSDIKLCVLTLVYAALLEPKQERPVYNGQPHNNGQSMSIVTILMVPISVPKTTIVLVYGQEYILPP
ncbi:uncharacterized protein LOC125862950 isoform X1 [Solanum stenotomum]|uniref:uncharacterized protein LOC125862950 isoform X1 n=1 Tax=Solanum stenotomum TaxID=172797 RepID=UPI0020D1B25C|nr:uncharacterized protein LOC125862950 isoform X1 [Solanum stenotomum]